MRKTLTGLMGVLVGIGAGCAQAPAPEPGNAELGIRQFKISETANGVNILAIGDDGAQLGKIDLQVGAVKSVQENHPDEVLPEYYAYGLRFEVSFANEHSLYDVRQIPPGPVEWGLQPHSSVFANDPAVAPILAKYHLVLPQTSDEQLTQVITGERPLASYHQFPSGGGQSNSLVVGCDGNWRQQGWNYPGSSDPNSRCTTPAPKPCNAAANSYSWGWYEAGGTGNVYSVVQSCPGGASGWPYTWSYMNCNTNSGGGRDGCGWSAPDGSNGWGRCSPCNANMAGANAPAWLDNYNNTSLGLYY